MARAKSVAGKRGACAVGIRAEKAGKRGACAVGIRAEKAGKRGACAVDYSLKD